MSSYAACIERHCPRRMSCLRYRIALNPTIPPWQAFVVVPDIGERCTLYIEAQSNSIGSAERVDAMLDLASLDSELIMDDDERLMPDGPND